METTQKFDQWVISKGTFYRSATPASEWFSVRVKDGAVEVASYGKYPMEQVRYSSLGKAIDAVDTHIANYYPQPKTAEERLKDAEAEIVTLKAKVAELEGPTIQEPFPIGMLVDVDRSKHNYADLGFRAITKREWVGGKWLYSRDGSAPWLPADHLIRAK